MKTKELLSKYKTIISSLISCPIDQLEFKIFSNAKWDTIGDLAYEKKDSTLDWCLGRYRLYLGNTVIASWDLYELPHCCAFAVSCKALVDSQYRGKRLGSALNNLRQEICRLLGYSALLCTDIEKNVNQRKLLKTNGWKDIHNLVNKRTQNRVFLSVINL